MTFHYRRRCTGSAPLTAPQGLCNTKSLQPLTPQSRMPSAALKACPQRPALRGSSAVKLRMCRSGGDVNGASRTIASYAARRKPIRCLRQAYRLLAQLFGTRASHSLVMDERDAVPSAAGELKVQITEVSILIVRYVRCHYVDRCEAQHSSNPHMDTGTMHTLCKSHRPMNCWSPDMARRVHGHVDVRIRALLLCILDEGRPRKDRHRQK